VGRQYKADHYQWNGKRIRALRYHLGLTQREMANRLGKYQQGISEWERGVAKLRGSSAKLLSIIAEQADFDPETKSSKETT
jgi:putative transcriptional regulator